MMSKFSLNRVLEVFKETFGFSPAVSISSAILIVLVILIATLYSIHTAPPRSFTFISGPPGSVFEDRAKKYRDILARNNIKVKILPSEGSLDNLRKLNDPSFKIDVGFVQGGVANGVNIENLFSLGSVFYEPLFIFYRGAQPMELLSELNGKRVAVGVRGTGSHSLSLTLLKLNGIEPGGATHISFEESEEETKSFLKGDIDALFLMTDSVPVETLRKLLKDPDIRLYDFNQAESYTRKVSFLNKLEIPKGGIDFGKNIPPHDLKLVGPTVELVARDTLSPVLSDLLLEAAQQIHGGVSLLQRRGEFPAPLEHEFPISKDATRYYTSGKVFLYRHLPFWLASLTNQIIAVFVPLVVILMPGLKLILASYSWRIRTKIFNAYRSLQLLEQEILQRFDPSKRDAMLARLDEIEKKVSRMKLPASYADQYYGLRGDIEFVRTLLTNNTSVKTTPAEATPTSS